ncbi:MAG TPA: PilZ domain-containing protein [Gemmataceae bacterium]|nr:PilZ domain-containing protein [Gemmataceae bacterium]
MSSEPGLTIFQEHAPVEVRERRKSPRQSSGAEIRCFPAGTHPSQAWTVQVRDVSDTGIGLVLKERLARGTSLILVFPATAGEPLHVVCARVVHSTPRSEGGFVTGCALQSALTAEVLNSLVRGGL